MRTHQTTPALHHAYYRNQSIEKAIAILRSFTPDAPIRGVKEVSDELGITRSVAQKIIFTLCDLGLLMQDPTSRKYCVSPRIMEIASPFLRTSPLIREGTSSVHALVRNTEMTCALGVRDGTDVLYLVSIEAQASVKANSLAGERVPLHCTATGKCLLAFVDQEVREEVLASMDFRRYTPNTITDSGSLARELDETQRRGYAINNEERVVGLCGVAVPIFGAEGIVAALSAGIPKASITSERFTEIIGLAKSEGSSLSRSLKPYQMAAFEIQEEVMREVVR